MLGPKLLELFSLMGRRSDDPEVIAYVARVLGPDLKPPSFTTSGDDEGLYVPPHGEGAAAQGLRLCFSHSVQHAAYVAIPKSEDPVDDGRFIPFLTHANIHAPFEEPPLGFAWRMAEEDIASALGPVTARSTYGENDELQTMSWTVYARGGDRPARVEVGIDDGNLFAVVQTTGATMIYEPGHEVVLGLFVAWALPRGLLDETHLEAHAELVRAVKARQAQGSALVRTAYPRGLWDTHIARLSDDGLAMEVYRFFWWLEVGTRKADLKQVFGWKDRSHEPPFEPLDLDDDTWEAVDKATSTLDARFARWMVRR